MKTKEDILFECWHESNDTKPTNETILKAMDRFAKAYHAEQLNIHSVSKSFYCQTERCDKQCDECGLVELNNMQ